MMQATRIGCVPDDFETCRLRDILVASDSGVWGAEPLNAGEGVITIRSTNFTNEGVLNLADVAKRVLSIEKHKEKMLLPGDILIERSGGSDTQAVGRVGFVSEDIAQRDSVFANFIQRIRVSKEMDAHYVHFLLQRLYELGITQSMQFQTTGIRNLDYKFYLRTVFPKPRKEEQQIISKALLLADKAISLTQSSIESAQKLKRAMMQNLLTGKLKPNGTWRRDDEFDIDPRFGRVPKGWVPRKLKAIFKLKNGKGNTTDNLRTSQDDEFNIPVFGGNGITGYFDKPLVTRRTLIIGRVGEYCGSVYLTPEKAWVTDNAMLAWEFMQEVSIEYLTYWLINSNLGRLAATTGQPKLTQGDIGKLVLIGP